MDQVTLQHAAAEAWKGFWHSCMRGAGGVSRLPFDPTIVEDALEEPPPAAVDPGPAPIARIKTALALQLESDERISDLTLSDVLTGLQDYFKIFRQVKKQNAAAYDYFSRVGAPLCFDKTCIWRDGLLDDMTTPMVDTSGLPSYMGLFMPSSMEVARDELLNDTPRFLDFQLYEKRRKNIAVASPWKWTLYDHQEFSLDRDVLTKAERRRMPGAGEWGFHYFIGIAEDGTVSALPMRMKRPQALRNGGTVHHSDFIVPPGLDDMKGGAPTVHHYVALMFALMRAYCASALSGVQVSIRRGKEVARFGIPLSRVRSFFRDRHREGMRRSPLMHYVGGYEYRRGDRTVHVGEHLRGARHFTWRDYSIVLSAPGIHHPSPEGLTVEVLADDDIQPMPKRGLITAGEMAARFQTTIESKRKVPFRKGRPTLTYRTHSLDTHAF